MTGRIITARPMVEEERLRVRVELETEDGGTLQAELPQREVAALLPRDRVLGTDTRAPLGSLHVLERCLESAARGRSVRYWEYKDRRYCSFISWRNVRFADTEPVDASAPAEEGDTNGYRDVE